MLRARSCVSSSTRFFLQQCIESCQKKVQSDFEKPRFSRKKGSLSHSLFARLIGFLPKLYYTCVKVSIQKKLGGGLLAVASGDWGYLNRGFSQIKGLDGGECLWDVQ